VFCHGATRVTAMSRSTVSSPFRSRAAATAVPCAVRYSTEPIPSLLAGRAARPAGSASVDTHHPSVTEVQADD
jgi:hypothetical protein